MSDYSTDEALQFVVRRARETASSAGDHLDATELEAYLLRSVSDDRIDVVQQHLAECAECTQRTLSLMDFLGITSAPAELALDQAEISRRWESIRDEVSGTFSESRHGEFPPSAEPFLAASPQARSPFRRTAGFGAAFAVGLILGALSFQIGLFPFSEPSSDTPRSPEANVHRILLEPGSGQPRTSATTIRVLEIPTGVATVLLELLAESFFHYPSYRVEVFNDAEPETPQWTVDVSDRTQDWNFNLLFQRRDLPDGIYRIDVIGESPEGDHHLSTYLIRLSTSPSTELGR